MAKKTSKSYDYTIINGHASYEGVVEYDSKGSITCSQLMDDVEDREFLPEAVATYISAHRDTPDGTTFSYNHKTGTATPVKD